MRIFAKIDRRTTFNTGFAALSMLLAFWACQNTALGLAELNVMASCIVALTTALLLMPPLLAAELAFSSLAKRRAAPPA